MKYSKKFQRLVRQTIDEKFKPMLEMSGGEILDKIGSRCPICCEYGCAICPIKIEAGLLGCLDIRAPFYDMYWEATITTRRMRSHVRKVIKWLETFLEES